MIVPTPQLGEHLGHEGLDLARRHARGAEHLPADAAGALDHVLHLPPANLLELGVLRPRGHGQEDLFLDHVDDLDGFVSLLDQRSNDLSFDIDLDLNQKKLTTCLLQPPLILSRHVNVAAHGGGSALAAPSPAHDGVSYCCF